MPDPSSEAEELPPKFCEVCGDPTPPGRSVLCDDCYGLFFVGTTDGEDDPYPDDLDD
jgi:hypothetical protein